ncbi:hypothetical protein GMST_26450 [Geomonas silvestris]|uniref:Uncharacterized protein n=1 Tax=Geomonas silvestris TaxID=2740184 RepID=A0A6V8MK00_9BACT|nr:hypothetical protein GMST_26450 [Geomonas silvestris]
MRGHLCASEKHEKQRKNQEVIQYVLRHGVHNHHDKNDPVLMPQAVKAMPEESDSKNKAYDTLFV